MLKVRDLTESLEKRYNLDEGGPTLDELPFDEIMNKESTEGNMNWYEEDHPTWKRYQKEVDEAYEYELDDELDAIMDDDTLSDDEKEQAISDLYSKYNYNESLNEANGNDPHRYVKLENPYRALIFDNGEVSISSIRPYDDGDYYYANYNGNKDNIFWICQNGRVKEKIKADPADETFSVVVDRLKELDSAVKQNMMHW